MNQRTSYTAPICPAWRSISHAAQTYAFVPAMATGSVAIILTPSAGFEFVADAKMVTLTGAEILDKPTSSVSHCGQSKNTCRWIAPCQAINVAKARYRLDGNEIGVCGRGTEEVEPRLMPEPKSFVSAKNSTFVTIPPKGEAGLGSNRKSAHKQKSECPPARKKSRDWPG